jgi:serine/threonine protein kinase
VCLVDKSVALPVRWTAPEALKYGKFSHKSDVWSFGIMLWELFSRGTKPYFEFNNQEVIAKVTKERYRLSKPDDCPEEIYELMLKCWDENPDNRPGFKVVPKFQAVF